MTLELKIYTCKSNGEKSSSILCDKKWCKKHIFNNSPYIIENNIIKMFTKFSTLNTKVHPQRDGKTDL